MALGLCFRISWYRIRSISHIKDCDYPSFDYKLLPAFPLNFSGIEMRLLLPVQALEGPQRVASVATQFLRDPGFNEESGRCFPGSY